MNDSRFSQFCKALTVVGMLCLMTGCATTNRPPEVPPMHTVDEIQDDYIARIDDPWQGFNRNMYRFNYHFDDWIFLPVVRGYEFITPTFAQTGISNFFNNIQEVPTFLNSLLQAKGDKALTTLGRFVTNTTIGILGFFDPATSLGMKRQDEDFGQTLGVWGVGTGPYVVLPVLGPNTVRSSTRFVVDTIATDAAVYSNTGLSDDEQTGLTVLNAVDTRHNQPFRYYGSGYPFEYYFVRFLFVKHRDLAVMK
jgi:phospholipid-binding lipoprotein MlaA